MNLMKEDQFSDDLDGGWGNSVGIMLEKGGIIGRFLSNWLPISKI